MRRDVRRLLLATLLYAAAPLAVADGANGEGDPLAAPLAAFQRLPPGAPVTPEGFGDLAFQLLEAGRAEEALPVFEAIAATRPDTFNRLWVAIARERVGDLPGAESDLRRLYADGAAIAEAGAPGGAPLLVEPGLAPTVRLHLAAVLLRRGLVDDAAPHVAALLAQQPWDGDVALLAAWINGDPRWPGGCADEALLGQARQAGLRALAYAPWAESSGAPAAAICASATGAAVRRPASPRVPHPRLAVG